MEYSEMEKLLNKYEKENVEEFWQMSAAAVDHRSHGISD